jgi:hypothetical protein
LEINLPAGRDSEGIYQVFKRGCHGAPLYMRISSAPA